MYRNETTLASIEKMGVRVTVKAFGPVLSVFARELGRQEVDFTACVPGFVLSGDFRRDSRSAWSLLDDFAVFIADMCLEA